MDVGATAQRSPTGALLDLAWVLAALGAYLCCAAFFIGADAWDPLRRWGLAILLANSVAIGLVGGRWWLLLAAFGLIALVPLLTTQEPVFYAVALPVFVLVSAALIALGVAVRGAERRRSAETERRAVHVGFGILAFAVAVTGWGIYLDHRFVDRSPSRPLLVDERTGGYRGIAPGAPAARARRIFGEPVIDSSDYAPRPLDTEPSQVSGPRSRPGDWQPWRYEKLVVFASGGRIRGYLTTDRSAQTQTRVGVGDSLVLAERRQPGLVCDGVTLGSDAVIPSYPACQGPLSSGHWIFFGGDPIDSIWVQERR